MARDKVSRAMEMAMASRSAYPDAHDQIAELELDSWQAFGKGHAQGFVGSTGKKVILAFRGSIFSQGEYDVLTWLERAFSDWSANLTLEPKQFHSGQVQGTYLDVVFDVWGEVNSLLADHGAKDKKLFIAGHSLGGGLAAIAGAICKWESGLDVEGVYTYGAPRVADESFARNYPVPLWRFENRNDIFPHLPPLPAVVSLLRVLSSDIEDALSRWFGGRFLDARFASIGTLQYLDKKAKIHDEVSDRERLVSLITAMVFDRAQLLQDHWIDSYCAAIDGAK